jgi:uncharacterized protein
MLDLSLIAVIGVALTFLLAGFVKGVIGLGLPTVAVGVLSLFMLPVHAAMLLVIPSFVTNVWQLAAGPSFRALLRRLWPMMAGVFAGTWLGIGFLTGAHSDRATTALGAALALYGILGLGKVRFSVPERAEPWASPAVGLLTGLVTGATGVFVIPAVPYLQALGLDKEDLIQALGLSFTVSTIALAVGLADGGSFESSYALVSLLALAPALLGMFFGQWIRLRVKPEVFRLCFFLGLLALGGHLILRSVF